MHVERTTSDSLAFPWPDRHATTELDIQQADPGEGRVGDALDQPSLPDVLPLNILYHQGIDDRESALVVAVVGVVTNIASDPQAIADVVQGHVGDSDVTNEASPANVGLDVDPEP